MTHDELLAHINSKLKFCSRLFVQERVPYGETAFVVAGANVEVAGARSPL